MIEKRFVYIEHKGADYILDTPNWELDFIEMLGDTLEAEEIVDLLNELHEEVERFDMFKTTVAIAIQHRIEWLKKQCWDNTDRIDELESLKKELKL